MIGEKTEDFVNGLIERTKKGKLDWKTFSVFQEKRELFKELKNGRGNFDYGINGIRETASYFLQVGEGYVFLLTIYHGDPSVTSPIMDTMGLMVKINNVLPLDDLSGNCGEEEQEWLENLRQLVENYLEEKYSYPDALYQFMNDVLSD